MIGVKNIIDFQQVADQADKKSVDLSKTALIGVAFPVFRNHKNHSAFMAAVFLRRIWIGVE